ncbi:MAG TPA: histidine kinase [Candidatus Limnocylindrales bacterium]
MTLLGRVTRERQLRGRDAPSVFDWLVAVAILILAFLEAASGAFPGPVGVAAALELAAILPVAFRRVAPLPAIAISAAVQLSVAILLPASDVFAVGNSVANAATAFLLIYSVGRHGNRRGLLAGATIALLLIAGEYWFGGRPSGPSDWAATLIFCSAALGLGVALRIEVQRSISLAVGAERASSERDAMAQAAVLEERARIARELHDVVAHNAGLIVLQAGGARSILGTDPDRARTALRQVEETGRQTLAEMRRLVGILRVDEGADRPLPRLERLPAPVDAAGGRHAPSVLDWLVAVALVSVAFIETANGVFPGPVAVAVAVLFAGLLPVAFRRVAPLRAIAISAAVFLPYVVAYGAVNNESQILGELLLIYSVGRHTDRHGLLAGAAIGLSLFVVEGLRGLLPTPSDWAYLLVLFGGALGLGVALRVEVQRSILLAVAAERVRSEQVATAQAAVRGERTRIARELHDVVADKVGLIVLQAGGARSVLDTDPERARSALQQVEEMGRQSLAEMRQLVGILRADEGGDRQPLPRLERLPAMVEEARAAGLTVELEVRGPVVGLPAGLELAVYRLIQEALTNVRKHAPTSRAHVRLTYEPDGLRIEVRDDGGPSGAVSDTVLKAAGLGHGLIGMRERVQLYDGQMQAGPMTGGGFRVEAVLPLSLEIA